MNQQLELDLVSLVLAENTPEQGSVHELCDELETAIARLDLPLYKKLEVAGNSFARIAGVFDQKANHLLDDWEFAAQPAVFPVMTDSALEGFIRQSMSVDLDEFLEPSSRRNNAANWDEDNEENLNSPLDSPRSVAQTVEKTSALKLIDILELAGNDCPVQWAETISAWLKTQGLKTQEEPLATTLPDLCKALDLAPVEVWLGLLLGNFQNHTIALKQDDFYQSMAIEITLK